MTYGLIPPSFRNWTLKGDLEWCRDTIAQREPVNLATDIRAETLADDEGKPTIYHLQLQMFLNAGYVRTNDTLTPP